MTTIYQVSPMPDEHLRIVQVAEESKRELLRSFARRAS
jgi:hypothetical protein